MYAITTLARLCRSRLWGAAVVAISLAAGAPAVTFAAGKTSECSPKTAKTAAQKRACANPKAAKSVAASKTGAKRAVATGSRGERRMMQAQMRNPGRNPQVPGGYMPPMNVMQGKGKRR